MNLYRVELPGSVSAVIAAESGDIARGLAYDYWRVYPVSIKRLTKQEERR